MNLNLFDGSMIVQYILEKAVKGMYLVVRIVKRLTIWKGTLARLALTHKVSHTSISERPDSIEFQ